MRRLLTWNSLRTLLVGVVAGSMLFVEVSLIVSGPARLTAATPPPLDIPASASGSEYIVLAWNDLGMHCYNRDFQVLAVLPPFNTLWAQVTRVGDPSEIVTTGITLTYRFDDNRGRCSLRWGMSPRVH